MADGTLIVARALLPGVALELYYAEQQREAHGQVVGDARRIATAFAGELERGIAETRQLARTVAELSPLRALDAVGCRRSISIVARALDRAASVLAATPDGWRRAAPLPSPMSPADRPYFRDAVARRGGSLTLT